jgi:hypothetical protein
LTEGKAKYVIQLLGILSSETSLGKKLSRLHILKYDEVKRWKVVETNQEIKLFTSSIFKYSLL